jgi:hypothetical protein
MAITLEQLSPTNWVFQDGATRLLELDTTNGVKVNSLTVGSGNTAALTSSPAELNALDGIASTVTVALTASTAANEMVITITAKDAAATTVAAVHQLEFWMSEAATGIGLTADAYSGDLVVGTGALHSAHTAKKHWSVVTAATGIFVGVLTDSAKPADQYVAIKRPLGAGIVVSAASGVNWGA